MRAESSDRFETSLIGPMRPRATYASGPSSRDDLWLDGVEYLLVTTIESCVDVAQHPASSENFGAPDSNASALRELGSRGVIDQTLAGDLALAVGFRDVLVHQYALVDEPSCWLPRSGSMTSTSSYRSSAVGSSTNGTETSRPQGAKRRAMRRPTRPSSVPTTAPATTSEPWWMRT